MGNRENRTDDDRNDDNRQLTEGDDLRISTYTVPERTQYFTVEGSWILSRNVHRPRVFWYLRPIGVLPFCRFSSVSLYGNTSSAGDIRRQCP